MAQYSVIKKEHFEFQCIWQQSTNWGHYFYVSGPLFYVVIRATVQYSAKGVTSFLGYFKTLSIGLALRIKPPPLQSSALPAEIILPQLGNDSSHIFCKTSL